ncbi:PAS domain-containing protein [Halostella sp. JP-L12]|uniref:PAS domain-containing protein n=1 Tax=Halostella TaxID=1843185 RepID=UPI000EF7A83A|nr:MULTISPECIES: PAS domain-containing protein [Halostella]NHN48351.1 PAS domain-containing protein [Halostella sp. JP-L12]
MIQVLYVDDDPSLLGLTKEFLETRNDDFSVDTVRDPREALSRVEGDGYDAVVSDYQMPEMDGLELLDAVRNDLGSAIPFVVFTGKGREDVAMEALNLGADRYLQKGGDPSSQYGMLARCIEQEVGHYRTQQRLQEREENLRIILESIGEAVVATDADGVITRLNGVAEELTGWDRAAAVGKPLDEVFTVRDGDSGEAIEGPAGTVLANGATVSFAEETLLVDRDGNERHVAESGTPMEDDEGNVVGVVVVFRDVTEEYRKQRRQERQQEALIELAHDEDVIRGNVPAALETVTARAAETLDVRRVGVWLLNEAGTELRCEVLYDRAAGEYSSGMTIDADEYPAYFDALESNRSVGAADVLADPRTSELAAYAEEHGVASLLDSTVRSGGDTVGVVCHEHVGEPRAWRDDEVRFGAEIADQVLHALNNRDRRERKRELAREKRFLTATVDALDDAFYALDRDRTVLRWNDRFESATGYDAEEIVGRTVVDFFEGEDAERVDAALSRVVEGGERVTVRGDLVARCGETRPYEFFGVPVEDDDEVVGVAGLGRSLDGTRESE